MAGTAQPAGAAPATIEVRGLTKEYRRGTPVLRGISIVFPDRGITAVIGPSGTGKSTLIRCINRLVEPTSGQVLFHGADMTRLSGRALREHRRRIGMVFQEYNLVERLTVMENVLSGRLGYLSPWQAFLRNYPPQDIAMAWELLDTVGLTSFANQRADALSGGQRQRVGIARALMQDPKLLLVDEPTSSLDPKISREVMGLIREIAREFDVPVLCNIHDVQLATEFATKIIGLQDGAKIFDGPTAALDRKKLEEIYAMEVL
jgi:phosphonate transport system ATP-binding protein